MDDDRDGEASDADVEPEPATALERLDPLEPYTTDDVASVLDVPRGVARRLLNALYEDDEIERKDPPDAEKPVVWVRPAPRYACSKCGYEFAVRFVHPVLARARYCPRCGAAMSDGTRDEG